MSEPNALKRPIQASAGKAAKEEGWWETVKIIVEALIIALVVRTLLFQPFNIPSGSLTPTLLIGDYLFVSKYAYGYSHYSLPGFLDLDPAAMPGRIFASPPKRGDVIVFKLPRDGETDYIKRLIGLPGDRIQMIRTTGSTSTARSSTASRCRPTQTTGRFGEPVQVPHYLETLPGGVKHEIIQLEGDNNPDALHGQHRRLRRAAGQLFLHGRQSRQLERFARAARSRRRRLRAVRTI